MTQVKKALIEAKLVLALSDGEGRRAIAIHAPEDAEIAKLCERIGYGAVMDSAARQWFLKDSGGAITLGACASTVRAALAIVNAALKTLPEN